MTQKPTLTRAEAEALIKVTQRAGFNEIAQIVPYKLTELCRGYLAYLDMVPVPAKDFKDGSWLLAWSKGELSESRPCTWNKKKKAWCDLPDEDRIEGFEPNFCIPLLAIPTQEGET